MSETDDMLERCARAVNDAHPVAHPWEDTGEHWRESQRKLVRAVLTELQDPTFAMVSAGGPACFELATLSNHNKVSNAFTAMIRRVLAEPASRPYDAARHADFHAGQG